jgi:hypothetical protein
MEHRFHDSYVEVVIDVNWAVVEEFLAVWVLLLASGDVVVGLKSVL